MPKTKWDKTSRNGFSLVELLTVIAVITILIGITIGVTRSVNERGRISRAQTELAALAQALEDYKSHYGDYPWIDGHGDPEKVRSRVLFKALMGLRGPRGDEGPPDFASRRRTFITADQFDLGHDSSLTDEERAEDDETYFLDPWGNPYEYYYKDRSTWNQNAPDPDDTHTWESPTYLLFSKGASGETAEGDPDPEGRVDYRDPENADNIYANRQ